MICGGEGAIGGDQDAVADGHAIPGINHRARIHVGPLADRHVTEAARGLDLDERVDHSAGADHDARATHRVFNIGELGNLCGRLDLDHLLDPAKADAIRRPAS